MSSLSDLLLRITVDPDFQTKGATLTFEELDANFILLANTIKENIVDIAPGGIAPYDGGTTYQNGDLVTYNNNLWEYISPTPASGKVPGTDPEWALRSSGVLSHKQNTDTHTDSNTFGIGDGTTGTNKTLHVRNGDVTPPAIRYNESTNKWEFSNNGDDFSELGTGGSGGAVDNSFSGQTATNLTLNPTKPTGNNFSWAIPAANPTLTWDFTNVPDGAEGTLEILKDANAAHRYIALPANSSIHENDYTEANDVNTSDINVSAIANNGSGLIRVTTSAAHGLTTGDRVEVLNVLGTLEANGKWTVTVIDPTNIDLQDSNFVTAYTSGGTVHKQANYLAIDQTPNAVTIISFYNRNGRMRMNLRKGYAHV